MDRTFTCKKKMQQFTGDDCTSPTDFTTIQCAERLYYGISMQQAKFKPVLSLLNNTAQNIMFVRN
jgi:hypothetical protein